VPAGHTVQVKAVAPLLTTEYCPDGQLVQLGWPGADFVPAAQALHGASEPSA
jgi:hypothetical protein